MKYAVNSREMQAIDEFTINEMKIPQEVLMERAAKEITNVMIKQIKKDDRILAVCGTGNNGGDGIAAGRILFLQGYQVAILLVGDETKLSNGCKKQLEIARNLNIPIENYNKLYEYNIVIDAIFGVGLTRPISGDYAMLIQKMNEHDGTVFSVDIPSGISADDGKVMNIAVKADFTITFGYQKLGLILYPGVDYAGEITIADIGFADECTGRIKQGFVYYDPEDLSLLPIRKNYSNKGTFGKVLIIAGSMGMSGAAYLSAKAAYRTGAGLVKILTSKENRIILQSLIPEALYAAYDDIPENEEQKKCILNHMSWADVIVIGPGLGLSQTAYELLVTTLENAAVPVIVDADGITLLARLVNSRKQKLKNSSPTDDILSCEEQRFTERFHCIEKRISTQVVLTPHLMELSRLMERNLNEIIDNLIDTALQCSYNSNLIYAIKDARTIVTQGDKRYLNVSGNNGMATGGSGDVLTGIIAALIAQGMSAYEATCLAVYIHGLAGDEAAKGIGKYSMMAGDIVESIQKVLRSASNLL